MNASVFEIFKIFFIIGIQLLGGGYVIMPLLKKYIVEERNWLTEDELVDYFAISQCIPGIIAANIATASGYKARGLFGATAAIFGLITPSFFGILIFAALLTQIVEYKIIQNAFWGIRISVVILIILTVKDLWNKSINSVFSYILFFTILMSLIFIPISPTVIILLAGIAAILYSRIKRRQND